MNSERVEKAVSYFEQGCCCSQSVLAAYADLFGMDHDTAMKISSGFGGGIGKMGKACGAFTGALMVLGLKFGSADPADKAKMYQIIRQAAAKFESLHGSISCKELLGFDMSTPEGAEAAKQPGSFDICSELVRDAAMIVEEMIS